MLPIPYPLISLGTTGFLLLSARVWASLSIPVNRYLLPTLPLFERLGKLSGGGAQLIAQTRRRRTGRR